MSLRSLFALAISLTLLTKVNAQQSVDSLETPESVLQFKDKLFVSNIGGPQQNPFAVDSNGFISLFSIEGKMIQKKFSKASLNAPKGLTVAGNTLYTADISRIIGININSGDQTFELTIPGAMLLNDVCAVSDNLVAVSETITGNIYVVNLHNKSYDFVGHVAGANGLSFAPSTKIIYACGIGSGTGPGKLYGKLLGTTDTIFTELRNSPSGVFDGLQLMDDNHLLVTDWVSFGSDKSRIVIYDLKDHSSKEFLRGPGTPDIYFDKQTQVVYMLRANTLLVTKISDLNY